MTCREIPFGSDDFRKECELRHEVLRAPLGLNLFDEDISQERQQMHFGLFDERNCLVACVIAVTLSRSDARIRQMAVRPDYQGRGHGRNLMRCLEVLLAQRGFRHLFLHARMTAAGFYEKLGYAKVGDAFQEIGISHVGMEKCIRSDMVGNAAVQ